MQKLFLQNCLLAKRPLCIKDICENVHLQNVDLPKCSFAKMFNCQNVHLPKWSIAKMFICQNVHLPKCSFAKMFIYQNVQLPKCSFAKFSWKIVVARCLFAICPFARGDQISWTFFLSYCRFKISVFWICAWIWIQYFMLFIHTKVYDLNKYNTGSFIFYG